MAGKSVGLIIFTEVPEIGLVAVLRERGRFNFEKWKPESWAGGCQVTVHGKLEDKESFLDALGRERIEELGQDFANLSGELAFWKESEIHLVWKDDNIETYAQKVNHASLRRIRLSPDGGGLRFLPYIGIEYVHDLIRVGRTGVISREVIAMFPDELEAVKSGFKQFMQ